MNDKINIDVKILEDICKYCEKNAIYDKLSSYGDFYYKIKRELNRYNEKKPQIWAIDSNWNTLAEFDTFEDADKWAFDENNKFFQVVYRTSTVDPVHVYL